MGRQRTYLLDADSFIRSKRQHYAFDFCPGYWDALLEGFRQKRVASIEPIRNELLRGKGKDALAKWVEESVPEGFFESVDHQTVTDAYAKVIACVQRNERYSIAHKQKFAKGADASLVAFASVQRNVLVTYEVPSPEPSARVKLPDVAREFGVECVPPYVMLRDLKVRLVLQT